MLLLDEIRIKELVPRNVLPARPNAVWCLQYKLDLGLSDEDGGNIWYGWVFTLHAGGRKSRLAGVQVGDEGGAYPLPVDPHMPWGLLKSNWRFA